MNDNIIHSLTDEWIWEERECDHYSLKWALLNEWTDTVFMTGEVGVVSNVVNNVFAAAKKSGASTKAVIVLTGTAVTGARFFLSSTFDCA